MARPKGRALARSWALPATKVLLLALTMAFQQPRAAAKGQESPAGDFPDSPSMESAYGKLPTLIQRRFSKILLYQRRLWSAGQQRSVVDDPRFFFAPAGKDDPSQEFVATYEAMLQAHRKTETQPTEELPEAQDPRCRFPARLRFVNDVLQTMGHTALPGGKCPALDQWLEVAGSEGLSLGFASMFPDGPSSMFGHTFLRIHSSKGDFHLGRIMMDPVVNFAAHPTSDNPLVFMMFGLFGGFPGFVAVEPMYLKLQHYNNAEHRDVWDYALNLDPEQVRWVTLAAWDLLNHRIDYYYFDDNCALLMLHFIEIADPSRHLSEEYWHWVTPSDTVRTVFDSPGLVGKVRFIPSQQRKLEAALDALEPSSRSLLVNAVKNEDYTSVLSWNGSRDQKAQLLDALLDYVDARDRLVGDQTTSELYGVRRMALTTRAELGVASGAPQPPPTPDELRPESAHRSHALGSGLAYNGSQTRFTLKWRPALKSHGEFGPGYSERMSISFLDTAFDVVPQPGFPGAVMIRDLHLIKVDVVAEPTDLQWPLSWSAGLEHVQTPMYLRTSQDGAPKNAWIDVPESRVSFAFGFASRPRATPLSAYALVGADLGAWWWHHERDYESGLPVVTDSTTDTVFVAPSVRAGTLLRINPQIGLHAETRLRWYPSMGRDSTQVLGEAGVSAFPTRDLEWRLGVGLAGLEGNVPVRVETGFVDFF